MTPAGSDVRMCKAGCPASTENSAQMRARQSAASVADPPGSRTDDQTVPQDPAPNISRAVSSVAHGDADGTLDRTESKENSSSKRTMKRPVRAQSESRLPQTYARSGHAAFESSPSKPTSFFSRAGGLTPRNGSHPVGASPNTF